MKVYRVGFNKRVHVEWPCVIIAEHDYTVCYHNKIVLFDGRVLSCNDIVRAYQPHIIFIKVFLHMSLGGVMLRRYEDGRVSLNANEYGNV